MQQNPEAKLWNRFGRKLYPPCDKLIRSFGEDKARLYLKAQVCACREYTRLCGSIDCDYEIKDSCVYSLCDRDKIEKEVAEPITIANEPYIMGVILECSNDSNRFYVQEVLIENGASPFKTGAHKGLPGGDAPSLFSLLQKVVAVKQNGASSSDNRPPAEALLRSR